MADRLHSDEPHGVQAWRETVTIPTYAIGVPDPNSFFLERRVYQGSSGAVYPYPVVESVANVKRPRAYNAVFLENEYLKIMILPELGGRVQMALDKTNDYQFIYYNRVIKPALVGLAGPWISGGIEFNWPQHHRPSTFHPVDCDIVDNGDGSWTVWCSEIDRIQGTKGMHGFTLHPGKAYLEIRVQLYNRTPLPQTFLWWANPAVHVDENHQSIFPPDVTAVMDHGKRDVSSFPIATGTYYKVDYSPGTDISRYKNIPVPTSYMAHRSEYDFVGSYDHGRRAGLLHVADRYVAPGKKQWTWGCGEFGQAWDRQLTDDDGPYVEVMCGAFTDNQPDFTWIAPGEEKSFSQYFMPYKGVGVIKNATINAVVGLDVADGRATVRVYVTSPAPQARVLLRFDQQMLLDERFDADPRTFTEFFVSVPNDAAQGDPRWAVTVTDRSGLELVNYSPKPVDHAIPAPAQAIDLPETLDTVDALYLAGIHLEQYRHATRDPTQYYREGLRRDPDDLRCNAALGRLQFQRGLYREALQHLNVAVRTATRHNPNPIDGEAHYFLGLALAAEGRTADAEAALHKAAWCANSRGAASFELARLALKRQHHDAAERLSRQCLNVAPRHHQAAHLLVTILLDLGRKEDATSLANRALNADPFNAGILFERALAPGGDWATYDRRMRDDAHNAIELANDYGAASLHARAVAVLDRYLGRVGAAADSPLALYHLARHHDQLGDVASSRECLMQAANMPRQGFFPNTLVDLTTLQWAVAQDETDYRAWCDIGNLLYSKQRYDEAICAWERSRDLAPEYPRPRRNLGLAYVNHRGDDSAGWRALSEAFSLAPDDARVLFELDQLARRLNHPAEQRLTRLQNHSQLVARRDDLSIEQVTLLNELGRHEEALKVLLARQYHPWEGGEGGASSQYVLALTEFARQSLNNGDPAESVALLMRALNWPHSLGEGKLAGIQENSIHYWLGMAHRELGQEPDARRWFERASRGLMQPSSATYYNDQPPEMIFYQGLAHRALGREYKATQRFVTLIDYGRTHLDNSPAIDYFAVSLPDFLVFESDLVAKNQLHCRYMLALGYLGLRKDEMAAKQFAQILRLDAHHLGAIVHQGMATLTPPVS